MRLYVEFDINNFEAWSGAVDTKNRISNYNRNTRGIDYFLFSTEEVN